MQESETETDVLFLLTFLFRSLPVSTASMEYLEITQREREDSLGNLFPPSFNQLGTTLPLSPPIPSVFLVFAALPACESSADVLGSNEGGGGN